MILVHAIRKTDLGIEWDIELVDVHTLEQAIEELGQYVSKYGYFVSMFELMTILTLQFFQPKRTRDTILIPGSGSIIDLL